MSETLSIAKACQIQTILRAAQGTLRVRWLTANNDLLEGTARAICVREGGGFCGPEDDLRDGFLWISGTFEHWLPVRDVMDMIGRGEFALDAP
jgi:hypothetical protein